LIRLNWEETMLLSSVSWFDVWSPALLKF